MEDLEQGCTILVVWKTDAKREKRGREASEETPADVQDIDSEHLNQETDKKKAEERMDLRHSSHFVSTTRSA